MSNYEIEISYEGERECGHRHSGPDGVGLYLVGGGLFEPCELMPWPLTVCKCCGAGIKFSRGFTWIDPISLFEGGAKCEGTHEIEHNHKLCPVCNPARVGNEAGLLWVGDKTYSPGDFIGEAMRMGISRRIPSVPNGFKVGEHIIYLAHIKAVPAVNDDGEMDGKPGIFMTFKPRRVDIVVDVTDPKDLPERAKHIKDRLGDAARIVKVEKLDGGDVDVEGGEDE